MIVSVVAGRQHAVKAAEVHRGLANGNVPHGVIDAGFWGRPYSTATAIDLGLPPPIDAVPHLGEFGGAPGASAMSACLEECFTRLGATTVLVYGDLRESVYAARAARSCGLRLVHIEAGLRSFDPGDSEEAHRIEIDQLAGDFVTHSSTAREILVSSGRSPDSVLVTASPLVATLKRHLPVATTADLALTRTAEVPFVLATLHREESLALHERVGSFVETLNRLSARVPVVLIKYGTTARAISALGLRIAPGVRCVPTLAYHDYVALLACAGAILTDSSGLQDEASALAIPCFTVRESTHRFDTIVSGTNRLVGVDLDSEVDDCILRTLGTRPTTALPAHWHDDAGRAIAWFLSRREGG